MDKKDLLTKELISLLKNNEGVNSHSRVGGKQIHLLDKDYDRTIEIINEIKNL